ncbi:MAG: hypothetical protein EBS38_07845 [Actinobacteria bacterium]|nr:hypothetical protein [Actinomycetota bacterium]
MSILITSPFTHISSNIHSHRAAQAAIYAEQLSIEHTPNVHLDRTGDIAPDPNAFDDVYVYHGNDWGGSLNLFGGMKNYGNIDNLIRYSKIKGPVYSLWIDHPKYSEMLEPRMKGEIHPDWHKVDWDNLKKLENTAITVREIESTNRVVAGDSHAICMYRPGWFVNSVPFKTLHGALKQGLHTFIEPHHEIAEFYFGNIDVRHHLLRQPDPEKAVRDLANRYYEQLSQLDLAKVYAYELLPIENESRALPKTGYYKGTPFYGSWDQRDAARLIFKDEMKKLCSQGSVNFIEWVDYLMNDKGELDFEHMEKPKSVHLSRASYPHWQGRKWSGLSENAPATLEDFFA